ncbi:MAG: DUF4835 family protein [Bacteroidales bacterium]|nr:DUF4835 family protein [Bacteroidales bacterium]
MRRVVSILLMLCVFAAAKAQELRCSVQINSQKLTTTTQSYETTDTKIFETMKEAIETFMNSRRWTALEIEQVEKLDCSVGLILSERTSATDFKGQLTIQLRRPVFNSNYTSGMFNYMGSNDFMFSFNENNPLEFDPTTYRDNLTSTLAYYAYIMLGMYFDSFGPNGGEAFFEMARTICQTAEPSGNKGWSQNHGQKARYWFMENHTNSAYSSLHDAYYLYHRMGLDLMTKDQPRARENIIEALKKLQEVHKVKSNLLSVTSFMDVKMSEITSIFTPAPQEEKRQVYMLVKELSPINAAKIKEWNK